MWCRTTTQLTILTRTMHLIFTFKSPKLEHDPLCLYSCITSPLLWLVLRGQLRASTQGAKTNNGDDINQK